MSPYLHIHPSIHPPFVCLFVCLSISIHLSVQVLEVSSPTAGSALLGPSQIQSLQSSLELTVRTTSAHGESCDSFPVHVPSKLSAIMAGPAPPTPVVPAPLPCPTPTNLLMPSPSPPPLSLSYGNCSAKVSSLPNSLPSDSHTTGLAAEAAAKPARALLSEDRLSSVSYVSAWANSSSEAALAACEATLPVISAVPPAVTVHLHFLVDTWANDFNCKSEFSNIIDTMHVLEPVKLICKGS